jgi:superfamily II DNA or RNA helicase
MILLTNRLYLPDDPEIDLSPWIYHWTEYRTVDSLDPDGNMIFREDGSPVTERLEIPHTIETYRLVRTVAGDFISLPRGDLGSVRPFLRGVEDRRAAVPLLCNLRMREHVLRDPRWPDQARMVDEWAQYGYGIAKGATGSGKTIVGMAAVCRMKLSTLILSKRTDAADQWTQEFRDHTNITAMEDKYGPLIGELTRKKTYPTSIATAQSFLSLGGWQHLLDLQDQFGLVLPDEVHELGSPEFSRVLGAWNPLAWLGLTATPERSDHGHVILYGMVGPIVTTGTANQMKPQVTFIETDFTAPAWIYSKPFPGHYRWRKCLDFIENDQARTKLILTNVEKDLDAGRKTLVYSERRNIIQKLATELRQDGYKVAYVDGDTKNRKVVYEKMRQGKFQVLCAGKVLDAMVNIPNLDCLHLCTPVNKERQVLQIYGRTRRPQEGKAVPLVRDYKDAGGQLAGAARNRIKICNNEGWDVKLIRAGELGAGQTQKWKPRKAKQMTLTTG